MGKYATSNRHNGTIFKSMNSDFRILIDRCQNRDVGGARCVFTYVDSGEYYVRLGSQNRNYHQLGSRQPINISIPTVIDIYDKQMESGNIEYNWLDEYDTKKAKPGEHTIGGCFACGKLEKTESQLTSDHVDTTRSEYRDGVFFPNYDMSSTMNGTYARKWHEDCVLSVLNPTINQVAQILEEEGALKYLRHNKSVHPKKFRD